MANDAPIIYATVGQSYSSGCCIAAVIWEGATTSGDTAELAKNDTGEVIWAGRTGATQTYIGANLGNGVSCPMGFNVSKLSAGRLLIYLRID
jgi:hypothetical protein